MSYSKYKALDYYARAVVIGLLLWFACIFGLSLISFGGPISYTLGRIGEQVLWVTLLIVCFIVGYFINKVHAEITFSEEIKKEELSVNT